MLIEENNIVLNCIESVYNEMKNFYIEMNYNLYLGKKFKINSLFEFLINYICFLMINILNVINNKNKIKKLNIFNL